MNIAQELAAAEVLAEHLKSLRAKRKERVESARCGRPDRTNLSPRERAVVLSKTNGRCHICGSAIEGALWQADHVLAHSSGGGHSLDNYLPAHALCNNYRWNYDTEEFQWILKLGVWLRTQIENQTAIGKAAGEEFVAYERRRAGRRGKGKADGT